MERRTNRYKRKKRRPLGAMDLAQKITDRGGQTGFALELDPSSAPSVQTGRSAGIYGQRTIVTSSSSLHQTRLFRTPRNTRDTATPANARSVAQSTASRRSRFSRASSSAPTRTTTTAVHIVCSLSENLACETAVCSLDAGSPMSMHASHQTRQRTNIR